MKQVVFSVTNDLSYDQRMHRICTTLAENNYDVLLVGRKRRSSIPLTLKKFKQKRLFCLFNKGVLFYVEFNVRLFFYLLFKKTDAVCAIDLDTILPVLFVSKIRNKKRLYDAHELFCEMKEIISRPVIHRIWKRIEKYSVPQFAYGYTVGFCIAEEFHKLYGVKYQVIRNFPLLQDLPVEQKERTILYQGAVNEGRALDQLLDALKLTDAVLVVCGDGNYMRQFKDGIKNRNLQNRVLLKGMIPPLELPVYAAKAMVGVNLVEAKGLNQYYSLANKFFDYIHAGLPQVCMNYPEYKRINDTYQVALFINDLKPETIARAINNLITNDVLYKQLQENCLKARAFLNWQQEEKKLLDIYASTFEK